MFDVEKVKFMLFCCKIGFVAIYALLSQISFVAILALLCGEKITKNCVCGEKMTNIKYVISPYDLSLYEMSSVQNVSVRFVFRTKCLLAA